MTLGVIGRLLGSKSAVVTLGLVAASTWLCYIGKIDADSWTMIALGLGGAYVVGEKARDSAAAFREGAKK